MEMFFFFVLNSFEVSAQFGLKKLNQNSFKKKVLSQVSGKPRPPVFSRDQREIVTSAKVDFYQALKPRKTTIFWPK